METRALWSATVVGKQRLAGDIWSFKLCLSAKEGQPLTPFSFQAGQFVSLHFQQGDELFRRSYSIATTPEVFAAQSILELAVHCLPEGHASQYLMSADKNTPLEVSGPFGQLLLPDDPPAQLLLIATGSGLAPYRSMLPQLLTLQQQGTCVRILMGAKTPESLFYQAEFSTLLAAGGQFIPCYSRVKQAPKGARLGYVQHQLASMGLDPERELVFLCGAPGMIDACWAELKALGFGVRQVKREKYTYSSH